MLPIGAQLQALLGDRRAAPSGRELAAFLQDEVVEQVGHARWVFTIPQMLGSTSCTYVPKAGHDDIQPTGGAKIKALPR